MSYIPTGKISLSIGGIEYHAQFRVVDKIIEVSTEAKTKKTQLGNSEPEVLARIILQEMIRAGEYKL
jgi:hypothetical protein